MHDGVSKLACSPLISLQYYIIIFLDPCLEEIRESIRLQVVRLGLALNNMSRAFMKQRTGGSELEEAGTDAALKCLLEA